MTMAKKTSGKKLAKALLEGQGRDSYGWPVREGSTRLGVWDGDQMLAGPHGDIDATSEPYDKTGKAADASTNSATTKQALMKAMRDLIQDPDSQLSDDDHDMLAKAIGLLRDSANSATESVARRAYSGVLEKVNRRLREKLRFARHRR